MKIIKYDIVNMVNYGTEENPKLEEVRYAVQMGWNAENEEIAKLEAHNGEYTIEDDGQPDPANIPSQLDRVEAQVNYTAMMTNTLMEGV